MAVLISSLSNSLYSDEKLLGGPYILIVKDYRFTVNFVNKKA